MVYKVLWRNVLPIKPGTPGRTPFSFHECTGIFNVHYITHKTNSFMSHPKDEASWFKCPCLMAQVSRLGLSTPYSATCSCWNKLSDGILFWAWGSLDLVIVTNRGRYIDRFRACFARTGASLHIWIETSRCLCDTDVSLLQ